LYYNQILHLFIKPFKNNYNLRFRRSLW